MAKPEGGDQPDSFRLRKEFPTVESIFGVIVPRLSELAKTCIFVLDTNALLTPYKVGEKGIADIGRVYKTLSEAKKLFVSAHAMREFARNRPTPLAETFDHLNKSLSLLPSLPTLNCPMLEGRNEYKDVTSKIDALKAPVQEYKRSLHALIGLIQDWAWDDDISLLYKELFVASTICDTSKSDDQLLDDLRYRTANKRPPGFKDGGKIDGGIGDVIIWHSLLELGAAKKADILFVSNDQKSDWVVTSQDRVLATRPELVSEFHNTCGRHFAVIGYSRFLEIAGASKETVGIVRETAKQLSATHRGPPPALTDGLTPTEVTILTAIAEESDPNEGVPAHHLRSIGDAVGIRGLLTTLAYQSLLSKELVSLVDVRGWNENYDAIQLTLRGWEWLQNNRHVIELERKPEPRHSSRGNELITPPDEDIPF